MTTQRYPRQVDCVWIASDRDEHIAAFVTAGVGPIPGIVLNIAGSLSVEDIEESLLKLPKVSGCHLLVTITKPGSFTELAERGLFVYDWSDVHRSAEQSLDAYEPMAVPMHPISMDALSDALKSYAANVKFHTHTFADRQELDVRAYFECDCS